MDSELQLEPHEILIFETQIGSSTMYVVAVVLTFIPPFIFGIALFLLTRWVDKRSQLWITDSRLVQYRQLPWPGKFSFSDVELKYIVHVGRDVGQGLTSPDQSILNRLLKLGDINVHFDKNQHAGIVFLRGIKNSKACKRELKAAVEKAKDLPETP